MVTKKKAPKKTKKVTQKKTHIAIVLDRSGSMSSIHKQTVDGLNQQFEAFRKNAGAAGDTEVSLIQFDTIVETVFDGKKPIELPELSMKDFQPRGGTAMYDGIWSAINHLKTKSITDDTAYLICVISDGEENSSREISQQVLTDEIKKLQDAGNWTFQYLLSNVDINAAKTTFAATNGNIAYYNATGVGSSLAYASNSASMTNYLNVRGVTTAKTMNTSYVAYSDETLEALADTK
jgi:Mg-chelatase subunit ChlD